MIDFDILAPNTYGAPSGAPTFGFDILGAPQGQGLLQGLSPAAGNPNGQGLNSPVFNATPLAGQPQQAPMGGLLASLFGMNPGANGGTPAGAAPAPGAAYPHGAQPQGNPAAFAIGTGLRSLFDNAMGARR